MAVGGVSSTSAKGSGADEEQQRQGRLAPPLARLAKEPERRSVSSLWKALDEHERTTAATYFIQKSNKKKEKLIDALAPMCRTRHATIRKWPDDKIAARAAAALPSDFQFHRGLVWPLLEELHVRGRREMVGRFRALLGAGSKPKIFTSEETVDAGEDEIRAAAAELARNYGTRHAVVYFLLLSLRKVSFSDHLDSWMRSLANGSAAGPMQPAAGTPGSSGLEASTPASVAPGKKNGDLDAVNGPDAGYDHRGSGRAAGTADEEGTQTESELYSEAIGSDAAGSLRAPADDRDVNRAAQGALPNEMDTPSEANEAALSLTDLDRVMIQVVLDAANEVVGSLSRAEVDAAIDELVRLSGRRPLSYYHAGFRDALFGRQPDMARPAVSKRETRCYWAGAIKGWARSESWPSIVREYDEQEVVQDLGDGLDFASKVAAGPTARALSEEGRTAELARFVRRDSLSVSRDLFELLLEAATRRLRAKEPAEARPILDLLAGEAEAQEGEDSPRASLFAEARRRHAQCLRQLKEYAGAKQCLKRLLELELDPGMQALLHADLGLVAGGFSSIREVVLPPNKDELRQTIDRLKAGEEHYAKSIQTETEEAARGRYCLGVLALARGAAGGQEALGDDEYGTAAEHLERARSVFADQRERCGPILPQTDTYYGTASICNWSAPPASLAQGTVVIARGLDAGGELPAYAAALVVGAAELIDRKSRGIVYDAILRNGDDATLDIFVQNQSALDACPAAVRALRERAGQPGRPAESVAADLRAALYGFAKANQQEMTGKILGELEALAQQGTGAREFAELLSDPARYEPVWSKEDAEMALVHLYEAQGEYEEATPILRELFHTCAQKFANHRDEAGLHDAEGILNKVKEFGIDPSYYEGMQSRYDALLAQLESEVKDTGEAQRQVKVLVVGGNEVQARLEDSVRAKLAKSHPYIHVEFIQTGWGSNWQKPLEEFNRRIPGFDAVVVMRFMRTELGKQIRKGCGDQPWRFCWGSGPTAQAETVIKAALAASPPQHLE